MDSSSFSTGGIMVFEGPGSPMKQVQFSLPAINPGEILVRNKYATICGSDLHTYSGARQEAMPTVLGHEVVGEIIDFGSSELCRDEKGIVLQKGDLVTWSIFASDPKSYNSSHGMPQKGDRLFKYGHEKITGTDRFHGGFGEYCLLKIGTAVLKIPEHLPLPIAATINCAISTVAGAIRLAEDLSGKNILIFGTGLLGLTCAAMCRENRAHSITVADISKERLEQAKSFGADYSVLIGSSSNELIHSMTDGLQRKGFDLVFDMSGSPDAMELGIHVLAIGGISVWVGAVFKTREICINAEQIIRRLITIRGLHNYNHADFVSALDFISSCWNKYPFESVVDKSFALRDLNEAFEYALAKKPLRVGVQI